MGHPYRDGEMILAASEVDGQCTVQMQEQGRRSILRR